MRIKHFRPIAFRPIAFQLASRPTLVRLTALLTLCFCLPAQTSMARIFSIYRSVTATSNSIVIRQPTTAPTRGNNSGSGALQFMGGWCYLSAGGTIALSSGGTISGGSAGTAVKVDGRAPASTSTITLDGTLGGTQLSSISAPIAAGGDRTLLGGLYLPYIAATLNQLILTCSGSSGTNSMYLYWQEP